MVTRDVFFLCVCLNWAIYSRCSGRLIPTISPCTLKVYPHNVHTTTYFHSVSPVGRGECVGVCVCVCMYVCCCFQSCRWPTCMHLCVFFCLFQPNIFRYTVIGGCHRLKAIKLLAEEQGNKELENVMVQVYGSEVLNNRKAVSWWANQHNELQGMQLVMKTQDKVTEVCALGFHDMN